MDPEESAESPTETNSQNSFHTLQNFVDSESSLEDPTSQPLIPEDLSRLQSSSSLQSAIPPFPVALQEQGYISSTTSSHANMSNTDIQTPSHQSNNWSNIPKLNSSTFFDWKRRIETTLGARRLYSHILEDTPIPTDPKLRTEHVFNEFRALEAIQFSCDADNFNIISDCKTARAAYLALCKYPDDLGGVTTANLFSELASSKLSSAADLKEHLLKFRNTHTKLKGNLQSPPDLCISDPFIAILILKSLPPDFNSLIQTSLANFETLTLDQIYALLNIEAKQLSGQATDPDSALVTTANCQPRKTERKNS